MLPKVHLSSSQPWALALRRRRLPRWRQYDARLISATEKVRARPDGAVRFSAADGRGRLRFKLEPPPLARNPSAQSENLPRLPKGSRHSSACVPAVAHHLFQQHSRSALVLSGASA